MSLMMLCIVVGVSAQDLSDGLVLHYTFESATDGTIPDVTGNGNVATINGGAVVGISEDGTKNVVALNGTDAYLTLMSSASTFAALSALYHCYLCKFRCSSRLGSYFRLW